MRIKTFQIIQNLKCKFGHHMPSTFDSSVTLRSPIEYAVHCCFCGKYLGHKKFMGFVKEEKQHD